MKFVLVLLTVLVTVSNLNAHKLPSVGSRKLAKELQNFVDLIPIVDVVNLVKGYLARDKEFQIVMSFMRGEDMKFYIKNMEAMPEFQKFLNYLQDNGLDAFALLNQLKQSMEVKPTKVTPESNCKITGSLAGFTKDLSEITPLENIANMFEYKVIISTVFRNFMDEIMSPRYTKLFTSTFTNHHFLSVMQRLKELDVDYETFHANFSNLLLIQGFIHYYL